MKKITVNGLILISILLFSTIVFAQGTVSKDVPVSVGQIQNCNPGNTWVGTESGLSCIFTCESTGMTESKECCPQKQEAKWTGSAYECVGENNFSVQFFVTIIIIALFGAYYYLKRKGKSSKKRR
ncbi:MAG: hypothetical protein KJ697_04015 [Nanoarchaeota archaeon]|nr:hypothetical protein [Nanoarchaeota archaeon]